LFTKNKKEMIQVIPDTSRKVAGVYNPAINFFSEKLLARYHYHEKEIREMIATFEHTPVHYQTLKEEYRRLLEGYHKPTIAPIYSKEGLLPVENIKENILAIASLEKLSPYLVSLEPEVHYDKAMSEGYIHSLGIAEVRERLKGKVPKIAGVHHLMALQRALCEARGPELKFFMNHRFVLAPAMTYCKNLTSRKYFPILEIGRGEEHIIRHRQIEEGVVPKNAALMILI
jgi:hypothetical protein